MANIDKQIAILLERYDKKHLLNLVKRKKNIDSIYDELAREAARIGKASGFNDPNAEFHLKDFPATQKRIDNVIGNLAEKLTISIQEGSANEWLLAEEKNKKLVKLIAKKTGIDRAKIEEWTKPHTDALKAFQGRKNEQGKGLSDRVWDLSKQTKSQIELALDLGLGEGKSAADLSRDVREYLREPHKLFRRVRDKHGVLRLSKNAQAYHPGMGVYRSSYKNALRMTATENNMAYRTADHEAWSEIDFVIGQQIQLSNNHTLNGVPFEDMCDVLQGKYPKDFKFVGWHPWCRCFVTPILADWNEQLKVMEKEKNGDDVSNYRYKGEISDVPASYRQWVADNAERIKRAKSAPYFILDNKKYSSLTATAPIPAPPTTPIAPPSPFAQATTTKEIEAILQKGGVVKEFKMGDLPLEDQKKIAEVIQSMHDMYDLNPIDIRFKAFPSKNSNTFMWANGRYVEANTAYWSAANMKNTTTTTYKRCVTDIRKEIEDRLKRWKEYLGQLQDVAKKKPEFKSFYDREIKKVQKKVDEMQRIFDSGMSRHNVFLSPETMLRDCFTHETGHTIHDQILGGINDHLRKSKYSRSDAAILNDELKKLHRKHKKAGGGWLSQYGMKDADEFLAESNVLYMYAPEKLPADVRHWFDLLKEFAKTGKLPQTAELPSVKFKPTKKSKKN